MVPTANDDYSMLLPAHWQLPELTGMAHQFEQRLIAIQHELAAARLQQQPADPEGITCAYHEAAAIQHLLINAYQRIRLLSRGGNPESTTATT